MNEEKRIEASGSWHTPTLGVYCPHCKEWFDAFEQIEEMDEWYLLLKPLTTENGLDIELTCPDCNKEFYLTETDY